jgi:sterol 3beta-glucosyltransferase
MRITLLTIGTRGDVQPYVALGLGLQADGHEVRLATHAPFEALIRSRGLDFSPVEGDPRHFVATPAGQAFLRAGRHPWANLQRLARLAAPGLQRVLDDCWQACQGTEAILASVLAGYAGDAIAERLGRASTAAYLQPVTPTRAFPSSLFPRLPPWMPGGRHAYNRLTYVLDEFLAWVLFRHPINRARQAVLQLPPVPALSSWRRRWAQRDPVLYGYSPTVLPKPPDWRARIDVTGYWFLPPRADWQPPAALAKFLGSGPPPVYVGFGSMAGPQAAATTALVVRALARAEQRGVLLSGWGGLGRADLPEHIMPMDAVPHDWLFRQLAAVVHHGGAGTTAAGLRAGVPSIVIPFMGDQPFWGARVYQLGAGPRPIPRSHLSVDRLAAAIRTAVTDPEMRARAAALGAQIRAEDGVARAVEAVRRSLP